VELWGTQEIAEYLGVTRQRVHQLAERYHDWPAPLASLTMGKVYEAAAIRAWAAQHQRTDRSLEEDR